MGRFLEEFDEEPIFEPIRTKAMVRDPIKKREKILAPVSQIESAVWQYLIDHSKPHPEGFAISFLAKSRVDFFRRVEARRSGAFKREDIPVMEKKVAQARKMEKHANFIKYRDHKREAALKSGDWILKYAIKIRAKLNRFIEKRIQRFTPPIKVE